MIWPLAIQTTFGLYHAWGVVFSLSLHPTPYTPHPVFGQDAAKGGKPKKNLFYYTDFFDVQDTEF
ncbi:MAG: hypothetical protein DSM106950_22030 [Stigonema ocellatum SAG 48.90 = DSM 106950]|nr:hypothetical protein [Stigonema ocellatum SAG 48.90 = DSM 106950]